MRNLLIAVSILIALLIGFAAGWSAHPDTVATTGTPVAAPTIVSPPVARSTNMGDEHETWENVPSTSPGYATAQRLLGFNYFAHDKHNMTEAKRHVDLALAASPDDPKVLEDAGRVYVLAGLTEDGMAMLKKANTPVAQDFLAHLPTTQPGGAGL